LDFDAGRPLAHAVDRTDLDRVLASRAERAGAKIYLGHRVLDVDPDAKSVSVRVRRCGNAPVSLRARSVVLATGAGVPLLRDLGWGASSRRLLGVQAELELDASNVEVYLGKKLAPEGFAWIIPLGNGFVKAGLLCHQNGPQYLRNFLDRKDIRSRLRGETGPIQCSVLPLGFLHRSYRDRILVVGEAAGHIKTTTCGGIYYGMLTAGMAAEVLDGALMDDRLGAESLSDYEKMWRELLQDEIETGMRLRRAFHLLNDFTLDKLVSLACRNGILELVNEKADFDWHQDLIRAVFRHATVSRILGLARAC
jgi:flavin-dependent dehydrogenase